jgi:hypothetical protein
MLLKRISLSIITTLTIGLVACGSKNPTTVVEKHTADLSLFKDVATAEVWYVEDGMNGMAKIVEDASEIQELLSIIGSSQEKKAVCKFTGGITFIKTDGSMIMAETNINNGCNTISYFNSDGKMEHHALTDAGVKILTSLYNAAK